MKIPKTFISDKDLEERTKHLLEQRRKNKTGTYFIDPEAEELFPNFVNYLKDEHDTLYVQKVRGKEPMIWVIDTEDRHVTMTHLGKIIAYTAKEGMYLLHGYEVEIKTKGKNLKLVYRLGYKKCDKQGIITNKEPARYDKEDDIPFP